MRKKLLGPVLFPIFRYRKIIVMSKLEKDLDNAWGILQLVAFLLVFPALIIWLYYIIFKAPLIEKVIYIGATLWVSIAFGFISWPF